MRRRARPLRPNATALLDMPRSRNTSLRLGMTWSGHCRLRRATAPNCILVAVDPCPLGKLGFRAQRYGGIFLCVFPKYGSSNRDGAEPLINALSAACGCLLSVIRLSKSCRREAVVRDRRWRSGSESSRDRPDGGSSRSRSPSRSQSDL
jgi:hypothetical protein